MQLVRGHIRKNDQPCLENIEIDLGEIQEPSDSKDWGGAFFVPPGTALEVGQQYRLLLQDGRKGQIVITRLSSTTSIPTVAMFRGVEPLR